MSSEIGRTQAAPRREVLEMAPERSRREVERANIIHAFHEACISSSGTVDPGLDLSRSGAEVESSAEALVGGAHSLLTGSTLSSSSVAASVADRGLDVATRELALPDKISLAARTQRAVPLPSPKKLGLDPERPLASGLAKLCQPDTVGPIREQLLMLIQRLLQDKKRPVAALNELRALNESGALARLSPDERQIIAAGLRTHLDRIDAYTVDWPERPGKDMALLESLHLVGPRTRDAQAAVLRDPEASLKQRGPNPLWQTTDPMFMTTATGEHLPLTLSYDSELPTQEVLQMLRDDPDTKKAVEALLSRLSMKPQEIAEKFKLTDQEVRRLVLRRGVSVGPQQEILLSQMTAIYAGSLLSSQSSWVADEVLRELLPLVRTVLAKRGLTVGTGIDCHYVEVRHPASEDRAAVFATTMTKLHGAVAHPQTHLHLGIPAVVSFAQAAFVAAAVEARTTLDIVVARPGETESSAFFGSILADNKYSNGVRGPVKLEKNIFTHPVIAHDLELRQTLNLEHGMDLLAMAVEMVKNHDRLPAFSGIPGTYSEPVYGNVFGALRFVASRLSASNDEAAQAVGGKLAAFVAGQVPPSSHMPAQQLEQIRAFLIDNGVLHYLDAEHFLPPPRQ